jgi:protein-tyrosine phosphatase
MAERVAEKLATERGLDDLVFTSAATSREEIGAPIDDRAVEVLRRHGYRTGGHAAHQVTRAEI